MNNKIFLDENDDPIDIRRDGCFKAVFTKDTPESQSAISELVSALIGRSVSILTILANEPPIGDTGDRQIRFDINCRAETGELIDVEMSFNPDSFEPVRLEYHAGRLYTGQNIKGKDKSYNDLKEAYQIAILAKETFFPGDSILHAFEYYDPVRKTSLNGRTRIITLELKKLDSAAEKPVDEMDDAEEWAFYLQYLTDRGKRSKINEIIERNKGIANASEVLMTISRDEEEQARLMGNEKYQLDVQSAITNAKREGIQLGEKQGIQKGIQLGEKQGIQKGIQLGEKQEQQKVISLLKSGKSVEEILSEYNQQL
jgi:predicted transposase/invertase (TIGR01784 family)